MGGSGAILLRPPPGLISRDPTRSSERLTHLSVLPQMSIEESSVHEEFLKDPTGEIGRLRKFGITDYAIITYVVRIREGRSKERAMRELLQGRSSLTEEQKQLVRTILQNLPIK